MTPMGSLIGAGYAQKVTEEKLDKFIEMTLGMYGSQGFELVVGIGPEECEGAVDVELSFKINGDSVFLRWKKESLGVEPGRDVPEWIEVDMGPEVDRVASFRVEDCDFEGSIITLTRHHMLVSRAVAVAAIREYLTTGSRPTNLNWEPIEEVAPALTPMTGQRVSDGYVPVTDDPELNDFLVRTYDASERPQTALWAVVDEVGIEPPFRRSLNPQPFSIATTESGSVIQWQVADELS